MLGASGYAEKSLVANADAAFLSWHDIEFVVPVKTEVMKEKKTTAKGAREKWIEKH